jgi:hypothetical protein
MVHGGDRPPRMAVHAGDGARETKNKNGGDHGMVDMLQANTAIP